MYKRALSRVRYGELRENLLGKFARKEMWIGSVCFVFYINFFRAIDMCTGFRLTYIQDESLLYSENELSWDITLNYTGKTRL